MQIRRIVSLLLGGLIAGGTALVMRERRRDTNAPALRGWPRVVVVGGGFGGLRVAQKLAGAPADVLLIDRHNYHCFQPLLYQVATAALEPEAIAYPIRRILRGSPNARFRMAAVQRVCLEERKLLTDEGPIDYDYLVLAAGSTTNYFGNQPIAERSFGLKNLDEAVALRNHILECFERASAEPDEARRAALLTFVVAGGGPTGVEFAGALAELIRLVLVHDYPGLDLKEARVLLIEGGPALLAAMAPSLQKEAQRALLQKGVEVRVNAQVKDVDAEAVYLADGTVIRTNTLVWAAGVRATDIAKELGTPLGKGGRVRVEPTLQLADHPEVFVIGDLAYLEDKGGALPMIAPVAIQQGNLVAENIRRLIAGQPLARFSYRDPGKMATVGRNAAVFEYGRLRLRGFLAWVMWLTVHLMQLVGFRNRLVVLVNWAWDYLFFDRAVRLISQR